MTQLTPEQLRQFQTDGFLVIPHFFDAREISAMLKELERFKREGLLRNVAAKTQTEIQNLQICPITPKSEFFRALPFVDKIVVIVRQLIGDPAIHHLDQIFLKPAQSGSGTAWHQDNAYFHLTDPTKGVGMWVALHDANVTNGTMHVVPRAFAQPLAHDRDSNSAGLVTCTEAVTGASVVPVELKAGGVLFFNYGVPHCTQRNATNNERAGLALHFVRQDYLQANDGHGGKRNSDKTILTGPDATGGKREFGQPIAGTWPQQIHRVLSN